VAHAAPKRLAHATANKGYSPASRSKRLFGGELWETRLVRGTPIDLMRLAI